MNVTKRSGKSEQFNEDKIKRCAERACDGIEAVSYTHLTLPTKA